MINDIAGLLRKNNIDINQFEYEDTSINYTFQNDRLFFYCIIHENADELVDYNKLIATFIYNNLREFVEAIGLDYSTEEEANVETPDMKAILWELNTIGIRLVDGENTMKKDIVSKIERDMSISRKIFIEDREMENIIQKIVKVIQPQKEFDRLFEGDSTFLEESEIVDKIKENLSTENEEIYSEWNTYKDINDFLQSLK